MVRTHRIEVRVTEEERELILRGAERARRSVSDFVRLRALGESVPQASVPPSSPSSDVDPGELYEAAARHAGADGIAYLRTSRFRCPTHGCDFTAAGSKARCPHHSRTVVPA